MDSDEVPPPPYSAVDPLLAPSNNRNATSSSNANPNLLRLRGGDAPLRSSSGQPTEASPASTHFTSAAAYFAERPPPVIEPGEQALEHHLTIYPRSQAKDFPRRPRCWSPRMENIAQQDWDMFLRHLFPPHLGLASASAELPRQVRAEIRRDRKDRPQETDEERERRIATVMMEWNQCFFDPRAVRIAFFYVTDPRNAPASPLCPRCYPAATRASQENRSAQIPEAGRGRPLQPNANPAATGYPQTAYPGQAPSPYGFPDPAANPAPYPPPQGPSGFYHPANPHAYQYPPYQYQQWGWGNQQYPQQYESSSMKGGPLGWFSNLAAQAQKYGDRISEHAQQYGDSISAHASHYGRQVEEQAMAHGRWIEEQAGLGGRKAENAFTGWPNPQQQQPYYPYYYPQPNTDTQTATQPHPPQASQASPQPTPQPTPQPPTQRPRRDSVCSQSSDSSLSSIDSISTTSELSSSDLATVRAQLLSLDDHHDRDLYEAAVELRRQLDALRESRRQARVSGRGRWRPGWGHQSRNDSQGRSSWGRWESPQDRQRNQAERRAAKEELRATRKAFRDILRRARDEQREQRRMKRTRHRLERRARRKPQTQTQDPVPGTEPSSLEQRLQNLELESNREARSTVPSSVTEPSTQRSGADRDSESSAVSSISTPSTSSEEGDEHAKKALDKECK
ncbi:hypothetical protein BDW59DRAFT_139584 [Aspergillus cavernicola]|uniref:Uncharacterized protein n=1 Tax=Aspergillus cavernicola TaxID=176166 RepID=A0ABR4IW87_9EURO